MKFAILNIIGILFISQIVWAQKPIIRNLKECIEIAVANNPLLRQQELKTKRNKIQYNQAWQNQLPTMNANLGHGYNQGRTIDPTTNQFVEQNISSGNQSLNTSMILFDGMRILSDIRMKANAKVAGRLEYEGEINVLKLNVIEAYINVLTAQDMLDQGEKQWELTKQQYERSSVLNREGAISPSSYYDVRGQYNLELNNLQIISQTLYSNRLKLANLLNCPEAELGTLADVDLEVDENNNYTDWDMLYEQARLILPEYRAFGARVKEAQQGIKVAQSGYFPRLSLGAGMNSNYSSYVNGNYYTQVKNNLGKYLSFSLSIPIFTGFVVRNQVRLAKINLQDVTFDQERRLNELRMNTSKAVFDLHSSREQVLNLQEQEKSYAELHRISKVQFEEGATNSVDYLTAKNKWDSSKNQLIMKKYQMLFQQYLNDYYAGKLNL